MKLLKVKRSFISLYQGKVSDPNSFGRFQRMATVAESFKWFVNHLNDWWTKWFRTWLPQKPSDTIRIYPNKYTYHTVWFTLLKCLFVERMRQARTCACRRESPSGGSSIKSRCSSIAWRWAARNESASPLIGRKISFKVSLCLID